MMPSLTKDLKAKIMADVDKWLEGTDAFLNPPLGFTGKAAPKPAEKSPVAPSRQGQSKKTT
jgi:hypothetical protein